MLGIEFILTHHCWMDFSPCFATAVIVDAPPAAEGMPTSAPGTMPTMDMPTMDETGGGGSGGGDETPTQESAASAVSVQSIVMLAAAMLFSMLI